MREASSIVGWRRKMRSPLSTPCERPGTLLRCVSVMTQTYLMCKAGASSQRPNIKCLSQRLPQIGKGRTGTEIHTGPNGFSICQHGYLFTGMVGAAISGIDAMVGGKENGITWAHYLLYLGKPVVHVTQRLGVAFAITP